MIWLFMAVWVTGRNPSDYKVVAKIGPFDDHKTCYAAGALSADAIQSKDAISNAIGACIKDGEPQFLDFKGMWGMVCASVEKPDMCWLKNGEFVDPLADSPS